MYLILINAIIVTLTYNHSTIYNAKRGKNLNVQQEGIVKSFRRTHTMAYNEAIENKVINYISSGKKKVASHWI